MTVDPIFADPTLADLYDTFSLHRRDFDFYLPFLMAADSVLDVGCGTGELLHSARQAGHTGRLCGLDPAAAMLDLARQKQTNVEWILGDLSALHRRHEFDLVVMTGHAFQVFIDDDQLRHALATIRSLLNGRGRFAFETRNPLVRAWERWSPEHAVEVVHNGRTVRMAHQLETPVTGDLVSFTHTFTSPGWDQPQVSRSTLRFLDRDALAAFLSDAGFAIEQQFGDWEHQPFTPTSPEIITIARPARPARPA